jgi:hypothetical protein
VISAQAFHWVDPEVRFPRAAAALVPGGWLALLANRPEREETPLRSAMDAVYVRFAAAFAEAGTTGACFVDPLAEGLEAAPEFGPIVARSYPWSQDHPTAEYLERMATQSNHRMLRESARAELFDALRETISDHGGVVPVRYQARLLLSQRSS